MAPIETWSGPLGEMRAAGAANGGTALSTTRAYVEFPQGTKHLWVTPRNFAGGATVAKLAFNPYLVVLVTPDNLTTNTDYSQVAQDADSTTSVVLDALNTLAQNDEVLIGARAPLGGLHAVVPTANAVAATLAVSYWNGAWTAVTALADGTASAGATFGQTGDITWTAPTDGVLANLLGIRGIGIGSGVIDSQVIGYWYRLTVSAQLSATVRLSSLLAINRSAAYAEHLSGQTLEQRISHDWTGTGCLEAVTDAGTANLLVNVATPFGTVFPK